MCPSHTYPQLPQEHFGVHSSHTRTHTLSHARAHTRRQLTETYEGVLKDAHPEVERGQRHPLLCAQRRVQQLRVELRRRSENLIKKGRQRRKERGEEEEEGVKGATHTHTAHTHTHTHTPSPPRTLMRSAGTAKAGARLANSRVAAAIAAMMKAAQRATSGGSVQPATAADECS